MAPDLDYTMAAENDQTGGPLWGTVGLDASPCVAAQAPLAATDS
ncbi:MAG TPA: hypothetical protein VIM14_06285 [Polyangia bacterium]